MRDQVELLHETLDLHSCTTADDSKPAPAIPEGTVKSAYAWAHAVVERCSIVGPSGSSSAILPGICVIPQVRCTRIGQQLQVLD